MSVQYKLSVKNDSNLDGSICVYQKDPEQKVYGNLYSTAWFTKAVAKGTKTVFTWSVDYGFIWCETGKLTTGVTFEASQIEEADPSDPTKSVITFTRNAQGAYTFSKETTKKPPQGGLMIEETGNIPNEEASIGLAMSGKAAFVTQAEANLSLTFEPHPEYWIAFGTFEEGEVLDVNTVSKTAKIKFPLNVYSKSITFGEDHLWHEGSTLLQKNKKICSASYKVLTK